MASNRINGCYTTITINIIVVNKLVWVFIVHLYHKGSFQKPRVKYFGTYSGEQFFCFYLEYTGMQIWILVIWTVSVKKKFLKFALLHVQIRAFRKVVNVLHRSEAYNSSMPSSFGISISRHV